MERIESWKPINGYEGLYEISSHGRVRRVPHVTTQKHYSGCTSYYYRKPMIIQPNTRGGRYLVINLRKNGKSTSFSLHRLVAEHFLEREEGKDYINHLDANPKNNHVDNLEWCTQSRNIQYAYDTGRKIPPHMKKVNQYTLNGDFIKTWRSIAEASRETNALNIRNVCLGKRNQSGGYKWKFAE